MSSLDVIELKNLFEDVGRYKIQLNQAKQASFNLALKSQVSRDIEYLNRSLNSALSQVDKMPSDAMFHRSVKEVLGLVKCYDEFKDKFSKGYMEDIIEENIGLAYKLEKKIRQKLYLDQPQEITDLAIATTNLSSNIIAAHLNDN